MLLPIILSFAGFSLALFDFGTIQSVEVTGSLVCNEEPATDVKVKLYEKEITFDHKMDEGRTNKTGGFKLHGSKREISSIDPKLYIYHDCERRCRKLGVGIPKNFVVEGTTPYKTFDIGKINLAGEFTGESTDWLCYF